MRCASHGCVPRLKGDARAGRKSAADVDGRCGTCRSGDNGPSCDAGRAAPCGRRARGELGADAACIGAWCSDSAARAERGSARAWTAAGSALLRRAEMLGDAVRSTSGRERVDAWLPAVDKRADMTSPPMLIPCAGADSSADRAEPGAWLRADSATVRAVDSARDQRAVEMCDRAIEQSSIRGGSTWSTWTSDPQ